MAMPAAASLRRLAGVASMRSAAQASQPDTSCGTTVRLAAARRGEPGGLEEQCEHRVDVRSGQQRPRGPDQLAVVGHDGRLRRVT